jgi:hypothetical protein
MNHLIKSLLRCRKSLSVYMRENRLFISYRYFLRYLRQWFFLLSKRDFRLIVKDIKNIEYLNLRPMVPISQYVTMSLAFIAGRNQEYFLHVVDGPKYDDVCKKKIFYTRFYDNLIELHPKRENLFIKFIDIHKLSLGYHLLVTRYIKSESLYMFLMNKEILKDKSLESALISEIGLYEEVFNRSKIAWHDASFCNILAVKEGDSAKLIPIDFQSDVELSKDELKMHNKAVVNDLVNNIRLAFANKPYRFR